MSSATPSPSSVIASRLPRLATSCLEGLTSGVRALAFWTAALLPLVTLVGVAAGAASQYPELLGAALALNVVCAVVGHDHRLER